MLRKDRSIYEKFLGFSWIFLNRVLLEIDSIERPYSPAKWRILSKSWLGICSKRPRGVGMISVYS